MSNSPATCQISRWRHRLIFIKKKIQEEEEEEEIVSAIW